MSGNQISELIRDWRQGDKRRSRRRTFANNPKGYRELVARVANEFIPQVRAFITGEPLLPKAVVKAWMQLVAELTEDMRMLDAFDPTGRTQFYAAIIIAEGGLRDKEARKAFESSERGPVDVFGNPPFISSIAASLDTVLDQTYHAMRGMVGQDLSTSLFRNASQRLHTTLIKGLLRDLSEANSLLLAQLAVVEMELERMLIQKSDTR